MSEPSVTKQPRLVDPDDYAVIADLVEDRLREFAARAADTIAHTIPAYRGGDPALRSDIEAHCRDAYAAFIAALRRGGEAGVDDFTSTADRATRRVAQGISLTDFLRAFRIVQGSLWTSIQEAAEGDPVIERAAPGIVAVLMQTFEIGSVGAANAYLEAQQYALADMDRLRRDLIEDVLDGRAPVAPARVGLLRAGGLSAESPFVCVVGQREAADEVAGTGGAGLRQAVAVLRECLGRERAGLIIPRQNQVIALLPARHASTLSELSERLDRAAAQLTKAGAPIRLGMSTRHARLADAPQAHHEAIVACRAITGAGALRLDELRPSTYLTLLHDPTARRLIRPSVRQFIVEDKADDGLLVDTLVKYAASDLNARSVADVMHLHVNSIYYRLERISERTGLDMRTFEGVEELLTAIRLLASEQPVPD